MKLIIDQHISFKGLTVAGLAISKEELEKFGIGVIGIEPEKDVYFGARLIIHKQEVGCFNIVELATLVNILSKISLASSDGLYIKVDSRGIRISQ